MCSTSFLMVGITKDNYFSIVLEIPRPYVEHEGLFCSCVEQNTSP